MRISTMILVVTWMYIIFFAILDWRIIKQNKELNKNADSFTNNYK